MDPDLLRRTAESASEYLTSLPERPVRAGGSLDELRSALRVGLDAAIAADWLTSVWDQNAAGYLGGPSAAVAEEVACEWLLDILGLPDGAGVGMTTGCQMAHF